MGITVKSILTDNGKEYMSYWGSKSHIFEEYLKDKKIKHRYTKIGHLWTNGFVEGFNRTLLEEFYQISMLKKIYSSLEELQRDLNSYLYFYNF